jgi:transaldolase
LVRSGIKVNVTACMSFGQAILATKAGATFVSLFAGRMSDEGVDAPAVIAATVEWLHNWAYPTQVIVGSIREAINVQAAAMAGAHVVTVPPKFLNQLVDHKFSRFTVQQFLDDGRTVLESLPIEAGARENA